METRTYRTSTLWRTLYLVVILLMLAVAASRFFGFGPAAGRTDSIRAIFPFLVALSLIVRLLTYRITLGTDSIELAHDLRSTHINYDAVDRLELHENSANVVSGSGTIKIKREVADHRELIAELLKRVESIPHVKIIGSREEYS